MTRPGIAAIASALLVEIFVSLLQDPQGILASAPLKSTDERGDHPLGLVPHQIRGFLSNFQNVLIRGKSYDCCSACSDRVTNAFKTDGWKFVRKALNEKGYVEILSGLAEVSVFAQRFIAPDSPSSFHSSLHPPRFDDLIENRFSGPQKRLCSTWTLMTMMTRTRMRKSY